MFAFLVDENTPPPSKSNILVALVWISKKQKLLSQSLVWDFTQILIALKKTSNLRFLLLENPSLIF